jgi:hypothetical protein
MLPAAGQAQLLQPGFQEPVNLPVNGFKSSGTYQPETHFRCQKNNKHHSFVRLVQQTRVPQGVWKQLWAV